MTTGNDKSQQSASYPYVPINIALKIAEGVKQLGGNKTGVPKSLLASTLKEVEKSQAFSLRIASAKCFGLIEGRSVYTLSENAKRYFFPTSANDKIEASLAFLKAPSGFSEIIKRFDGQQLPETRMLANLLHTQLKVPESWSVRAAQFFNRSAQQIGVIDEQGFLRFDAARHSDPIVSNGKEVDANPGSAAKQLSPLANAGTSESIAPSGYHQYVLPLADNRKVTIMSPLDVTPQEIKRLTKWIEFTLQVDWGGEEEPK